MLKLDTKKNIAAVEAASVAAKVESDFIANRAATVEAATVVVNGNIYNANERSIQRMTSAVLSNADNEETHPLRWSMADTASGVMTDITLGELKQALKLATVQMELLWAKPKGNEDE